MFIHNVVNFFFLIGGALPLKKGTGRELFLFFVFQIKGSKRTFSVNVKSFSSGKSFLGHSCGMSKVFQVEGFSGHSLWMSKVFQVEGFFEDILCECQKVFKWKVFEWFAILQQIYKFPLDCRCKQYRRNLIFQLSDYFQIVLFCGSFF